MKRICFVFLLLFYFFSNIVSSSPISSIAFYYGPNPPLNKLRMYDVIVVNPDQELIPRFYDKQLYASVSIGEIIKDCYYCSKIKSSWLIGHNENWNSSIIDLANPEYQTFLIENVIKPLWDKGYRGFFLDTLDSYQITAKNKDEQKKQQDALISIIKRIKTQYPNANLIWNRGFEVLPQVHDDIEAVAAESLFAGWNNKTKQYYSIPQNERDALLKEFAEVKKYHLPAISIEYLPPEKQNEAANIIDEVKKLDIIPWVTDNNISSVELNKNINNINYLPRKILVVYAEAKGKTAFDSSGLYYAAMPLEYLGYVPIFQYAYDPLPNNLKGEYAGVLIWIDVAQNANSEKLTNWIINQINNGIPVVIMENLPFPLEGKISKVLGLTQFDVYPNVQSVSYSINSPINNYEIKINPNVNDFVPMRLTKGNNKILIQLQNNFNQKSDQVAITPWGGYAFYPHSLAQLPDNRLRWVINPIEFFAMAFKLPRLPVPDVTTHNGRRIMTAHVDGDALISPVEWNPNYYAGEEMKKQIFDKYKVPTTVSVIEGEFDLPQVSPEMRKIFIDSAKDIFKLPWIEIATHTYSHPFDWQEAIAGKKNPTPEQIKKNKFLSFVNLPLPNYHFNIKREVVGSVDFINKNLAPRDKKCKVILWSGNADIDERALDYAYQIGLRNMNGIINSDPTNENNSLTNVGPLGLYYGKFFQVFSPFGNELGEDSGQWSPPYYSFMTKIQAFQLTDSPLRLKPIDIYYHFYSSTKQASLRALQKVYDWALTQSVFNMYESDFVNQVWDFNDIRMAKKNDGLLITTDGYLKELRSPKSLGYPDFAKSKNVVGFTSHGNDYYIHLGPDITSELYFSSTSPNRPYLDNANGYVTSWQPSNDLKTISFKLKGYMPLEFTLGNMHNCTLSNNDKTLQPEGQNSSDKMNFKLKQTETGELKISCQT